MAMAHFVLGLGLFAQGASGGAVYLNEPEKFEATMISALSGGPHAFIVFQQNNSKQCQDMQPEFDKLGDAFKDHSRVIIGEVDCLTEEGTKVCDSQGLKSVPVFKYWTPAHMDGQKYWHHDGTPGARDFASLKKFVEETLLCNAKTRQGCTEKEEEYIDKTNEKTTDDVYAEYARLGKIKAQDMTPEAKSWLFRRLAILEALYQDATKHDDEL